MIRRKLKVNKIKKGKTMKEKDFFDLTAQMEKECGDWEDSEGLSEKAIKELMKKVEALDAEEAAGTASKGTHFHMKKRYFFLLAAAMVLLLGMGAMGDQAWISQNEDMNRASEFTTKIDNEEKENVLLEEEAVYQEIAEELGIAPIRLGYIPDGMELDSYTVMESTGWAYVNYLYKDSLVSVQMTKKTKETSSNIQWDGEYEKLEDVSNSYGYDDCIEAYRVDEEYEKYIAGITYGNGYYRISGFSDKTEFLKILKEIYFKNL